MQTGAVKNINHLIAGVMFCWGTCKVRDKAPTTLHEKHCEMVAGT